MAKAGVPKTALHELRRQRSVTYTNLARWREKSEAKESAYLLKLSRVEREIAELEKAESK